MRPPKHPEKGAGQTKERKHSVTSGQPLDRMALLAHQIRTPLSAINALAQGLMRRADRLSVDEVRGRSERIWRASLHLNELIETIMSYTRASAGSISLNLSTFNLEEIVLRVCEEQKSQQPQRTLTVDLQELPGATVGDPILLEQVLLIILSNAMKYSPPSEPIMVSARVTGDVVSIDITDKGIGISDWDLPFLMQPFFRGRNAKNLPGTGLGLSLAWHILKLHGGGMQIRSQEGHGTTVTMTLPLAGTAGGALQLS
jgi:two-component system sensor histidine kinase SenX3